MPVQFSSRTCSIGLSRVRSRSNKRGDCTCESNGQGLDLSSDRGGPVARVLEALAATAGVGSCVCPVARRAGGGGAEEGRADGGALGGSAGGAGEGRSTGGALAGGAGGGGAEGGGAGCLTSGTGAGAAGSIGVAAGGTACDCSARCSSSRKRASAFANFESAHTNKARVAISSMGRARVSTPTCCGAMRLCGHFGSSR